MTGVDRFGFGRYLFMFWLGFMFLLMFGRSGGGAAEGVWELKLDILASKEDSSNCFKQRRRSTLAQIVLSFKTEKCRNPKILTRASRHLVPTV